MTVSAASHIREIIQATANNKLAGIQLIARNTADYSWYIDNRGGLDATNNRLAFIDNGTTEVLTLLPGGGVAVGGNLSAPTGNITGLNLSGTNTGDQTITLTGNVTGSGTGSFATTIAAGAVTNAMLAGSIDLTTKVTGVLPVANGGTNISSYAIGDLLYASASGVLSKLADVAAGSYLRSGGVTTAPLWSTLILPNAATSGYIPYATATNTWGESANLLFTGSAFGVNVTPTGVIHGKASADASIVGRFTTTTNSTASGNLIQAETYDGAVGFAVSSVGEATIGRTYDYANGKHPKQHSIIYASGGVYSGAGLKLNNLESGSVTRLHSYLNGLYITNNTGTASPLLLGNWTNPGDSSTFKASGGRWIIDSGWLIVNSASARGYGQLEVTSTSLPQFVGFYDTSNYCKQTVASNGTTTFALTGTSPTFAFAQGFSQYNGITTAGWGVPAIYAHGRSAAQTAAVASVATMTTNPADASFEVSANVNVTTSTDHNFTVTCTYTDETNTSRTLTLGFTQLSGATFLTAITNVTGAGPYESPTYHIRCKASTTITIATTGTFTTVVYSVEGTVKQLA